MTGITDRPTCQAYHLRNSEDFILSASGASEGGHTTIDMISGSALWGAMANQAYKAAPATAFDVLYDSDLVVTPAFPVTTTGLPAFPVPACLAKPKHEHGGIVDGKLDATVRNLTVDLGKTEGPFEALKGMFLAQDLSVVRPSRSSIGKSAIKDGGRRAADEQFFQYEFLEAGQDWIGWVISGERTESHFTNLTNAAAFLGRSRSAEFGGNAAYSAINLSPPWWQQGKVGSRLLLWCLTDIVCIDGFAQPDHAPELHDLGSGLPEAVLSPLSVISTRRYGHWNRFLGNADRELSVISAGSVLVYDLPEGAEVELGSFARGLGLFREKGFGLVWPNPPWALEAIPANADMPEAPRVFATVDGAPAFQWVQLEAPTHGAIPQAMLESLKRRANAGEATSETIKKGTNAANELKEAIHEAQKKGLPVPASNQWQTVMALADLGRSDALASQITLWLNGSESEDAKPEWTIIRALALKHLIPLSDADLSAIRFVADILRQMKA